MKLFIIVLLVLLGANRLAAEELSVTDFAAGYAIDVGSGEALLSVFLPLEVYQTIRRSDLGDIRVFNGAGEGVPHGFRQVTSPPQSVRQKEVVPFFPLYAPIAGDDGRAELAMRLTRTSDGTIVDIETGAKKSPQDRRVSGYILDLSGLKWPVGELSFAWRPESEASIYTIAIQHSKDLEHWATLVGGASLVKLQFGGQQIEKNSVQFMEKPQKYLKFSWTGIGPALQLTGVTGYSTVIASMQQRQWVDVQKGNLVGQKENASVDFVSQYHVHANSAQLVFREPNSIARLALQSRPNEKTDWWTRCEQLFYNLTFGDTVLTNEPCTFPPNSDQFFRVVVKEDGAGIRNNQLPALQLGWYPSELLFLARGAPPFLLAFGSGKLEHEELKSASDMILTATKVASMNQTIGEARLGQRITLGGAKALEPPPPPTPWKKWLLWGVLVFGVMLLAAMARNLLREMKNEQKAKCSR